VPSCAGQQFPARPSLAQPGFAEQAALEGCGGVGAGGVGGVGPGGLGGAGEYEDDIAPLIIMGFHPASTATAQPVLAVEGRGFAYQPKGM